MRARGTVVYRKSKRVLIDRSIEQWRAIPSLHPGAVSASGIWKGFTVLCLAVCYFRRFGTRLMGHSTATVLAFTRPCVQAGCSIVRCPRAVAGLVCLCVNMMDYVSVKWRGKLLKRTCAHLWTSLKCAKKHTFPSQYPVELSFFLSYLLLRSILPPKAWHRAQSSKILTHTKCFIVCYFWKII